MKFQKIHDYVIGPFLLGSNNTIYRMLKRKNEKDSIPEYIIVEGGADVGMADHLEIDSSKQVLMWCYPGTMIPMREREINFYRPVFQKKLK